MHKGLEITSTDTSDTPSLCWCLRESSKSGVLLVNLPWIMEFLKVVLFQHEPFSKDVEEMTQTIYNILSTWYASPLPLMSAPKPNGMIIFALLTKILDILQPNYPVGIERPQSHAKYLDTPQENGVDNEEIPYLERIVDGHIPRTADLIGLLKENRTATQQRRVSSLRVAFGSTTTPQSSKPAAQESNLESWFFWQFDDQHKIAKFVLDNIIREENFSMEVDSRCLALIKLGFEATLSQKDLKEIFDEQFTKRLSTTVKALSSSG